MIHTERFVERILETENLTDELEDSEAQRLLDWGLARLEPLLAGVEDEESAGAKVNELMAVMRRLNRLAPRAADGDLENLTGELARLDELVWALYPEFLTRDAQAYQEAAQALATLQTPAALELLLAWLPTGQNPTNP